ncbi:hypothetical protein [Nonomuraea sp. CA-141351]|uniref:hypothetical protein n=1 Tax=Nonomuraea sp. CA-141351 TaxID=3239996 RepID=UPI003D8F4E5B
METREFVWTREHVFALIALCLAQVLDAVDTTVVICHTEAPAFCSLRADGLDLHLNHAE